MSEEWLTIEQVTAFEGISRMEVYNRMQPGDSHPLVWKNRGDGKPGRLIDPASLTVQGRERLKELQLSAAMDSYTHPATSLTDKSIQLSLIPGSD